MVEFIELEDIKKEKGRAKRKKFFKAVGKGARVTAKRVGAGAKVIGAGVAKGAGELIKKAKEAQSPEAQERRLVTQEKRLIFQERIAKRRARIQKLQPRGEGFGGMPGLSGSFFGGNGGGMVFKPLDMNEVLTGGPPRKGKGKGKAFDPLSQI